MIESKYEHIVKQACHHLSELHSGAVEWNPVLEKMYKHVLKTYQILWLMEINNE